MDQSARVRPWVQDPTVNKIVRMTSTAGSRVQEVVQASYLEAGPYTRTFGSLNHMPFGHPAPIEVCRVYPTGVCQGNPTLTHRCPCSAEVELGKIHGVRPWLQVSAATPAVPGAAPKPRSSLVNRLVINRPFLYLMVGGPRGVCDTR